MIKIAQNEKILIKSVPKLYQTLIKNVPKLEQKLEQESKYEKIKKLKEKVIFIYKIKVKLKLDLVQQLPESQRLIKMQGGIPTIIPQQILQLKQIFGVNTTIPRSIALMPSDRMFYIAGYYGVVYNPKQKQKSQSYYAGADDCQAISTVTLSSNRKLMAMGFKSTERPCIYYYELNASAKRRKIQFTDNNFSFNSWVSLAFSANADTKHLASLTNKNANGQSVLAFWNPQRGKCQAYIKIPSKDDKDFSEIIFNPNSQNFIVSVLGEKTLKFYELKENIEQKSFVVEELQEKLDDKIINEYTMKSHSYLGTSQSILILANEGAVIVDYKASVQQIIKTNGTCTANWSQGFILAHKDIVIYKYEDQQYKEKFTFENKDWEVSSISVNEDKILVLLNNGSFMTGKIKSENNKNTVKFTLEPINLHYHSSAIVGMDVCIRKPLIATASKDKTIKIWNYQERTVQTPKSQSEAASCLSFHPSGFHLAVAYSDKLRIINLQKDGQSISNYKDINSFKNCTAIKFSNGGQYLAAASGNLLHLFKFYTGQNPSGMTFTGHTGKIKGIAWSKQDNIVVTCGTDGIVLAYRVGMENCGMKLLNNHSTKEPRIKGISYSSVAITQDNTIYAIGSIGNGGERVFRQIKLYQDNNDNRRQLAHNNCSQICFPSTGRILFCGTEDKDKSSGSIKCYKFPNIQHMQEFQAHDFNGVQKLSVTSDDKYLVSAGKDGALMVFEIRDKQARSDKLRQVLPISNEILINKTDMDTLKAEIDNLKQEKKDLEGPNNSVSIKDDHVKQLKDKYHSDETQFMQKYNAIIEKKNVLRKKFDQEIRTKKEQFENGLQQFDSNQAKYVMQESAKYDQLKRSQQQESQQFKAEIKRYEELNQAELQKMAQEYQNKIKASRQKKNDVKRKIERLFKQHEETMKQIGEQKEEQLRKIENEYSQQVQNITEASLRAKSDVSITKKKIQQKKQEQQNNTEQQRQNKDQIKRLEVANQQLQKQIQNQALIIQDRDKTIDANQRKIYDLKKKAQELQKFKYVLDHKIKELKKDIAPREQQITKMKAQTNKMDKQLKDLNSLNTGLAQFVAALFKNEEALKAKIAQQRNRISYQNNKIKSFKDALYSATQLIQNEEQLKQAVTDLKNKFVSHSMVQAKMDSEIQNEYKNQKKYLQKSINMLKKNLQKDSQIHKHENIRIMKENVALIKEISSLRLQIRQDNNKRGSDDDKKGSTLVSNNNKNEPKEEELKMEIEMKKTKIEMMRNEIEDIQERINSM